MTSRNSSRIVVKSNTNCHSSLEIKWCSFGVLVKTSMDIFLSIVFFLYASLSISYVEL